MNIEIISTSGKIGVGKNYVAEKILLPMLPEKNTVVLSFADHFKIDAITKDGVPYDEVFVKKTEKSRKALQKRGTEEGRLVYGPMIWVDTVKFWIQVLSERGIQRVIIGDVRFVTEADSVREWGGTLIRVNAPKRNMAKLMQESNGDPEVIKAISSHQSEIELDEYPYFDLVLDNDENPELYNTIRDFIRADQEKKKEKIVIFCDLDQTICECTKYYTMQTNKLLAEIKKYLKHGISHRELEERFFELYSEIEGNYHQYSFTRDRYPKNLMGMIHELQDLIELGEEGINLANLIDSAARFGYGVFDYNYEPLGESLNIIKELSTEHRVVIVTMGNTLEQKKKIVQLGLTYLDNHVTHNKNEDTFFVLKESYPAQQYVMIGDSLTRDIIPAINAGINYAYWIGGDIHKAREISDRIICIKSIEEIY